MTKREFLAAAAENTLRWSAGALQPFVEYVKRGAAVGATIASGLDVVGYPLNLLEGHHYPLTDYFSTLGFGLAAGAVVGTTIAIPESIRRLWKNGPGLLISVGSKNPERYTQRLANGRLRELLPLDSFSFPKESALEFISAVKKEPKLVAQFPQIVTEALQQELAKTDDSANPRILANAVILAKKMPALLDGLTPEMFEEWTKQLLAVDRGFFSNTASFPGYSTRLLEVMASVADIRPEALSGLSQETLDRCLEKMISEQKKCDYGSASDRMMLRTLESINKAIFPNGSLPFNCRSVLANADNWRTLYKEIEGAIQKTADDLAPRVNDALKGFVPAEALPIRGNGLDLARRLDLALGRFDR